MTTTKDSQQHEIKDLSTAEENVHVPSTGGERSPLIGKSWQRITWRMLPKLRVRYQRCYLTSNAVILILVWNLILVVGFESFLDPGYISSLIGQPDKLVITTFSGASYSVLVFLFLFYPLAGCLADIRWGRYKTVVYSLCIIWGSLVLAVVLVCLASLSFIPVMIDSNFHYEYLFDIDSDFPASSIQIITLSVICVVFGLPVFIAMLFMLGGLVCFSANISYNMGQIYFTP